MRDTPALNILVVEDDADTRANLTDILELDQHHVQTAASFAEASQIANLASMSIVLMDRKLPDGDAEDLLPRLRQLAPAAEVLIVTGYRDLEGALACLHQGAADYILKPVNAEALRANLRRVGKSWQMAERLRLLATAVHDVKEGILITDAKLTRPGPIIVFVNEAITRITGYSEAELLGQTPRLFQSSHTDRRTLDRLKEQLRAEKPCTVELINRRKDGLEYCVELHVSPVHDPSGRVTNYVSTHRDITDRKRTEERILQSERLAAIGEMVTGLAHESRNALQRSKACLELLALEVEDRPEALDLVERVNKAHNHLHLLYEEVRSYAAPLNLRRDRLFLPNVWREAWSQLELARRDRTFTLREEIEGQNLELDGDPFALCQVFRNILENAIAACPDPGEIVIGCMPVLLAGQAAIQISLVDNGPGLSAEQRQRIFDPFFTTKTKGTGLGMAIARRIVEAHGGRIAVGEQRGGGAEILVTLPRQWQSSMAVRWDE